MREQCGLPRSGSRAATPLAPAELAHDARAYIAVMRQHIYKEDHVLFPMAERMLSPEAQAAVVAGFEALDCALEHTREKAVAAVERIEHELGMAETAGHAPRA
jgi:hemerythrin-like domain-containing protein